MSKIVKKFPILGSSSNAEKIGLTVKGAAIALIPIVIAVLQAVGIDVLKTELINLVEAISAAVAAIIVVIGLARKTIKKLKK